MTDVYLGYSPVLPGFCNELDSLEHHGVLGQKWGVRRYQNPDGSRTALGTAHEQVLYGKGVNLKVSEVTYPNGTNPKKVSNDDWEKVNHKDITHPNIAKGTTIYRIAGKDNGFGNKAAYVSYLHEDVGNYLVNPSDLPGYGPDSQLHNAKLARDVKVASANQVLDTISELYFEDAEFRKINGQIAARELIKSNKKLKDFDGKDYDDLSKKQKKLVAKAMKKMDEKPFSWSQGVSPYLGKSMNKDKIVKKLKEKGFDAMVDIEDISYQSVNAHDPLVLFEPDKVLSSNRTSKPVQECKESDFAKMSRDEKESKQSEYWQKNGQTPLEDLIADRSKKKYNTY